MLLLIATLSLSIQILSNLSAAFFRLIFVPLQTKRDWPLFSMIWKTRLEFIAGLGMLYKLARNNQDLASGASEGQGAKIVPNNQGWPVAIFPSLAQRLIEIK
jgi:hypothetical protein